MRIAFIIGQFPSLSETFILNQITGLIDQGHHVDIYAEKNRKNTKTHTEIEEYNLLKNTYFFPHIPSFSFVRLLKGFYLYIFNFHRDPVLIVKSLNIFRFKRQAVSLRLLYNTMPFLGARPKYDVIQCHFGNRGMDGLFLREVGAIKGKLVTAFHGRDMSQYLVESGENVYEQLFKHGDLFLPISLYWKKRLIELGCDENKILVHHMGIDCQHFEFIPRKPESGGTIRIVSIARLVEKKGIEYGIRAIAELKNRVPDLKIKYEIIGDGELKSFLQNLIIQLNMSSVITILGWRTQEEVVNLLNHANILLAPSITSSEGDQEGIPVVLMEAMAMGLPIISTFHSGIPEIVADGVSGFLAPEKDIEILAKKIVDLINFPNRWEPICRNARNKVESDFDITQLNNKLTVIYSNL